MSQPGVLQEGTSLQRGVLVLCHFFAPPPPQSIQSDRSAQADVALRITPRTASCRHGLEGSAVPG